MRVFIWQEWASNHSANFTIAGRFETVEASEKAADELRQVVVEIAKWYELPENSHIFEDFETIFHPPSPLELKFAQHYNVKWEHALDWLSRGVGGPYISVFDSIVFVGCDSSPNLGPAPFDQIMVRMGGKVATYEEGISYIEVTLICRAPDELTAEVIFQACDAYFSHRITMPPWSISDKDRKMEQSRTNEPLGKEERMAKSTFNYSQFVETSASGTIVRTDRLVLFRKLVFEVVETGLPALIAYLKALGCTDIEYSLHERPYNEVFGER